MFAQGQKMSGASDKGPEKVEDAMCALISHNGVNKNTPCWRGWSFDPRDPVVPQGTESSRTLC